jgi:hypothetical protein
MSMCVSFLDLLINILNIYRNKRMRIDGDYRKAKRERVSTTGIIKKLADQ